jgi:hypothetical protein
MIVEYGVRLQRIWNGYIKKNKLSELSVLLLFFVAVCNNLVI